MVSINIILFDLLIILAVKGKGLSEGHLIKLPKKPVPAFFYFCIEKRKEYPNLGSVLEANHKLSQMWRDLAEDEKEVERLCLVSLNYI